MIRIAAFFAGLASPHGYFCTVTSLGVDGGLRCAEGKKVRVAGVRIREIGGFKSCPVPRQHGRCDDARIRQLQVRRSGLVLNSRLACEAVEVRDRTESAKCRLPDGRDLACAWIAAGAATRWERDWRRYRLGQCPSYTGMRSLAAAAASRREVDASTELCDKTIYRKMARGEFPKSVRLEAKAVGWREGRLQS